MGATVQAILFDYPVAVTKSDATDDPAGTFSALLVDTGGVLKITPYGGPDASSSITINVLAGQYILFPVKRVWSTTTTALVFGLVSPVVRQGP